jgi:sec-independent protein translocase protein TatA
MAIFYGFLPGSVGGGELVIIFLVVLIFFGPKRLPEIARTIGKTLHRLRQASDDFKDQVLHIDLEPSEPPAPEPLVQAPPAEGAPPDGAAAPPPAEPAQAGEDEPPKDRGLAG